MIGEFGFHIPVEVGCSGGLGSDHPHRCAFGIGAQNTHDTGGNADIDAARNRGLLGLARTLRIDDFEFEAVLLEYPGELANLGHRRIPVATLTHRKLQLVLCKRRLQSQQSAGGDKPEYRTERPFFHYFLPA